MFIILDKMDKIGLEGVKKELLDAGFAQESVDKYVAWFERAGQGLSAREFCGEGLADVLDPKVLDGLDDVEATHINLNDQTLEGLRHKTLPIMSVQYHPEAAAGPHDGRYLFERFHEMMKAALA